MNYTIKISKNQKDSTYNMICLDEAGTTVCKNVDVPSQNIMDSIRDVLVIGETQDAIQQLSSLTQDTYTTSYRFPLNGCLHKCDYEESMDGGDLIEYRTAIETAIDCRQDDDMVQYYGEPYLASVKNALISAVWGVSEYNGELYGSVTIQTTRKLDQREVEEIRRWICGQNSDGFGEGFEQNSIIVDSKTEIYVSLDYQEVEVMVVNLRQDINEIKSCNKIK